MTGLYAGNSPVTDEFPVQKASKTEMFIFDDVIKMARRLSLTNADPALLRIFMLPSPNKSKQRLHSPVPYLFNTQNEYNKNTKNVDCDDVVKYVTGWPYTFHKHNSSRCQKSIGLHCPQYSPLEMGTG